MSWEADDVEGKCTEEECSADEQPDCKDETCKGEDGKCTEDDHKGCECKDTCARADGEAAPKCADENCKGGEDGKCTADGDLKGCECEKGECPDIEREFFFAEQCGGADDQGKCKGVRDFFVTVEMYD